MYSLLLLVPRYSFVLRRLHCLLGCVLVLWLSTLLLYCSDNFCYLECNRHIIGDVSIVFFCRRGLNCLSEKITVTGNDVIEVGDEVPGQLYSPDDQCRQIWGPSSYLCRVSAGRSMSMSPIGTNCSVVIYWWHAFTCQKEKKKCNTISLLLGRFVNPNFADIFTPLIKCTRHG
jgi:hypothetical protein